MSQERFSAEELLRRIAEGVRDPSVPIDREAMANTLDNVADEIARLRTLAGAVTAGSSHAEIKRAIKHPEPGED